MEASKCIFVLGIILTCQNVAGDVASDWVLFYQNIFTDFHKDVFPRTSQGNSVPVQLKYYLNAINDFDEVSGVLKTTGYLSVEWTSQTATWSKKPRGISMAIEDTMIPLSELWHPPITLANSVNSLKELGSTKDLVWAKYDGTQIWRPPVILSSSCGVDPTYFPFDTQKCNLTFRAWDYDSSEVTLSSPDSTINMEFYNPNGLWNVKETTTFSWSENAVSYVAFEITMTRLPLWSVINMAAPIGLLGLLTTFTFLLPIEESRVGYALGSFLTFSVFLTFISDNLPKSSEPLSLLTLYIVFQVVMSGAVSLLAVFTVRLYLKDEDARVPNFLALFVGFWCCKYCEKDAFEDVYKPEVAEIPDNDSGAGFPSENLDEPVKPQHIKVENLPLLTKFGVPNIKWTPLDADREEEPDENKICCCEIPRVGWKLVARTLDYTFFLGTCAAHAVLVMIFLLPIYNQY